MTVMDLSEARKFFGTLIKIVAQLIGIVVAFFALAAAWSIMQQSWPLVEVTVPYDLNYLDYLQPTGFTLVNYSQLQVGDTIEPLHRFYARVENANSIEYEYRAYSGLRHIKFNKGDIGFIDSCDLIVIGVENDNALLMCYVPYKTKETVLEFVNGRLGASVVDTGEDTRSYRDDELINGTLLYMSRQKLQRGFYMSG